MLGVTHNGARGRGAQRAEGERSAAPTSGAARVVAPNPELAERAKRRRFRAEYKLRILQQADACSEPGAVGALLRREGLYTSHLAAWRQQREHGALAALGRPRGRRKANPLALENAQLRQRAERAEAELTKAQRVIEVQGKLSALLEAMLDTKSALPVPTPDTSTTSKPRQRSPRTGR